MKLLQLMFVFFGVSLCEVGNISEDVDLKLERQVKMMNRPPVKTFVTEEGDIIDCIDIDKQPAIDHPLLKNHKIQRKPKLPLSNFSKTSSATKYVQFRSRKPCPIGTVPIQRIKKEDMIRTRSLPKMPSVNMVEIGDAPPSGQHRVFLSHDHTYLIKYGASGYISIYNISTALDQFSSHNIWIETGPPDHISMIVAGWRVDPLLNADGLTRLFTYWTGDGFRDGCYNTFCQGFVQVDRVITPNYPLTPVSTYGGPIYELKIEVSQDIATGNWWLRVHDPPINVGYWSKELFVNLRNGSLHAAWGGVAKESAYGYCPPMGNGHMPDVYTDKAAYFRKVQWMNANGESFHPYKNLPKVVDTPTCYNLLNLKLMRDPWGYLFTFGGPGGYCRA
ncbi:hypothetical protein ACJRO7_018667 [Eucalyptus globulus]|uniref:Neprosin PEP catalytic domain-containing protein n=1 Tax=Eucalyptus globulus TaxID=34317 RepID=A0ABD3KUH7_EUCGL